MVSAPETRESVRRYFKNSQLGGGNHSELNLVQCYSVTTGKVSTIVKAPSFSSLSSIEVAEINHLSLQDSIRLASHLPTLLFLVFTAVRRSYQVTNVACCSTGD